MHEIRIAAMTPDDLQALVINCLKAFHQYHQPAPDAGDHRPQAAGKAMDIGQLCQYVPTLKRSTVYKLTSAGGIPHSKRGKRLYFNRDDVDRWLLENRIGTRADAESRADEYLLNATRRAR